MMLLIVSGTPIPENTLKPFFSRIGQSAVPIFPVTPTTRAFFKALPHYKKIERRKPQEEPSKKSRCLLFRHSCFLLLPSLNFQGPRIVDYFRLSLTLRRKAHHR